MSVARHPLEVSARASDAGDGSALVVVTATEGSTYVRQGAMAVFAADDTQTGWLSGGCLEPEIARRARHAVVDGHLDAMEIDTRDDEDLLAGSAVGCRGRLHLALLPLDRLAGWSQVVQAWWQGAGPLSLRLEASGEVHASAGDERRQWTLPLATTDVTLVGEVTVAPPPRVAIFGAGPETRMLVASLRQLGWHVSVIERRARWIPADEIADAWSMQAPDEAARGLHPAPDAALVMHHHFEHDREALEALAQTTIPFIGLLGPVRRREDLLRVIPSVLHASLLSRLRSPIGMKLGGQGPEAIALSITAQLQAWHHGERE
ncbi:XdhC/CoxI family protein [Pseudoxanthomonas sp. PXM02]|uniref:XdhC family protein n=1 Tax=Pseudoxanthomonas sp. PXM02 TaxID=2769294 RepID=UPI00177F5DD6|nr:XdhC/CoxI family protein [Pseudoxanthomonas sp. PXM02]MBD9478893.1 XdhC family protein [Pseudoxanthomonas sp. PXM02]